MTERQWRYKITTGKMPVVLSGLMLLAFGLLAYWMYNTQNQAVVMGALLASVMLLVFIAAIYRYLFYKVLIDKDGFYYQTNHYNGRFYRYGEIEKAWFSAGTEQNGVESEYCNVVPLQGAEIRIRFYPADGKALGYLVKQVEKCAADIRSQKPLEEQTYQITGKTQGITAVVIAAVLLLCVAVIELFIAQMFGFRFSMIPGIALPVLILLLVIIRYCCFKVHIGTEGFYFRTTPFNGRYYAYSEIQYCEEIKRVYRHHIRGRGSHRSYYFYFLFTDAQGITKKFQFEKPVFEHEINVLKERIMNANPQLREVEKR